jgi:hypothetical protein
MTTVVAHDISTTSHTLIHLTKHPILNITLPCVDYLGTHHLAERKIIVDLKIVYGPIGLWLIHLK